MADTVTTGGDSGMGFFMGVILLVVFGLFVFFYGLPYMRGATSERSNGGIQIPDKVDVNVNQPQK